MDAITEQCCSAHRAWQRSRRGAGGRNGGWLSCSGVYVKRVLSWVVVEAVLVWRVAEWVDAVTISQRYWNCRG